MLNQWLKQPLNSLEMIQERLDVVEAFVKDQEVRSTLYKEQLSSIPDVLMLNNKLARKRANLQDVFKIYQVVLRLPEILRLLRAMENKTVSSVLGDRFVESITTLSNYEQMVEETLDLNGVEKGEYHIKPSFDKNLEKIKEEMDEIEGKMRKEFKKASQLLGLDEGSNFKLDYVSHLGYHFRTTKKEDEKLRKHKIFETIDTARGGIRFTTEKLKDLNLDFAALKENYEETQKTIVQDIVGVASGYSAPLTYLNYSIAMLDVFISLAEVATNSPGEYTRPQMFPENQRILSLKTLRHPCLECQDDINYIPNDVALKGDETNMYIITGANISGKSTFIRSISSSRSYRLICPVRRSKNLDLRLDFSSRWSQ
jgi:DNA mismatch repair protein MSH2